MPASVRRSTEALVDTSVAVALVVADHAAHGSTVDAIGNRRLGLAGHAAFETFSVLTRLPSPARRPPAAVSQLLAENFPGTRFLSADHARSLLGQVGQLGIGGGAIYDAFVAACAVEHQMALLTRDRRAVPTYQALGAQLEVLPA